ncbi:MAG TPA: two-component regulator propeller domain-containing protein, partial [Candidatus Dormibacteraeota bacterium]|nr:two-component regulator propeller domain-containing protein [Candidatus Dormibacteraeota bacterium]
MLLALPGQPDAAAVNGDSDNVHHFAIDSWTTEKGLPQNSVITTVLGDDGYLWLGTLSGLVRFDGFRFRVFDANNTPGLRSSQIVYLFEDSQGNFWIGTLAAGVALARKDGSVTRLDIGQAGQGGRLKAACEDDAGAVWLYTADGELCRHRKGRMDVFNVEADRPSYSRAVIQGDRGRVLVGTDQQVYVIAPTADRDPKELPIEQTNRLNQLDFLLASPRGGYWRLADGSVQKWTLDGMETDLGAYPWRTALR